jgi:hypothetical protein
MRLPPDAKHHASGSGTMKVPMTATSTMDTLELQGHFSRANPHFIDVHQSPFPHAANELRVGQGLRLPELQGRQAG